MGVTIDTSEFRAAAAAMGEGLSRLPREVRAVVSKGALNMKTAMNADFRKSRHFKGIAGAVSYDMAGNAYYSEAQIGPEKGAPGSLANIAYFGTSRGGGTVTDPQVRLDDEAPRFEQALAEVAEKAVS